MRLFRASSGQPVTLEENSPIGAGGEARIFPVSGDPYRVAKLYHAPTPDHVRKLAAMLAAPPVDPTARQRHASIAWPTDLLLSAPGGPCVGFLMPRVSGMRPIFEYYNPRARRTHCPFFDYSYLLRTARNLSAVVAALHDRGYVIGDVNESNILVAETALVTIVDTDSFQVRDTQRGAVYRCPVGKPDFTPPELQGVSFSGLERGPEHDRFGLAVLLFQLLMEGAHPFDGRKKAAGEATLRHDRIKAGHFPYGKRRIPYEPSPATPPLELLHPHLQKLFLACFVNGHKNPKARPDANAWTAAIEEAEKALATCKKNARHRYGKHLRKCPWCGRTALLGGRDPFPATPADVNAQPTPPTTAPRRVPPRPGTPAPPVPPVPVSRPRRRGPKLLSSRTTVRRIPPGAAASAPAPSPAYARIKGKVTPFVRAAWKRSAFRPPAWTPPPHYAGVVTVLRTPIDGSPTVWTGMTLLFAILAFVPGLGFGAGLTAVACGVTEYRRMDRITLGSALGVGVGAGLAAKSVVMGFVLALLAAFPGLFPSSSLRKPEWGSPPLIRFSSTLSERPPLYGVQHVRRAGEGRKGSEGKR